MGDFWVFGYGSLMWRPGFAHTETRRARLHGFHRSLCVWSHIYRGTRERQGLVLGLDRGGSCVGLAFRVPSELREEVLAYLRDRELVTSVYLERMLPIRLEGVAPSFQRSSAPTPSGRSTVSRSIAEIAASVSSASRSNASMFSGS